MKKYIQEILKNALLKAKKEGDWLDFDMPEILVEYTKNEQFGDYTSNIAMVLARQIKKSPMEIAEKLQDILCQCEHLKCHSELVSESKQSANVVENQILKQVQDDNKFKSQDDSAMVFEKIEVANPGYLNFYLSEKYLQENVKKISQLGGEYGNSAIGKDLKVNNEFISANPTGPFTVGNGRGGFFGDVLSNVLRKTGHEVTSEYYVNDAGGQIEKLGHSVLKDEQAAYSGDYIDELNKKYGNLADVREIGKLAAQEVLDNIIKKTAKEKMHINFDVWMSEQKLNDEKYDVRAIEVLKEKGLTYELEGALWLKTTQFGDDKDRVLVKSDGKNAYIAGDCGYMLNKIERGYDRLIMSLGADHHGYVSRLKAVARALGFENDFRIIISQLVRLMKDGKEVRMSKRAGNVVEMDELIDEVGHDVARFFFLMYSPDTHMNFDLGLAKEQSQKNPVFYVQYAHARICSILAKASEITSYNLQDTNKLDLSLLAHEKELSLMKELDKFPEFIEELAVSYEVHKLPHFAIKLADKFHSFYDACRVIDEENIELTKSRILLLLSVKIVLAETLRLIGVSAPEKM